MKNVCTHNSHKRQAVGAGIAQSRSDKVVPIIAPQNSSTLLVRYASVIPVVTMEEDTQQGPAHSQVAGLHCLVLPFSRKAVHTQAAHTPLYTTSSCTM